MKWYVIIIVCHMCVVKCYTISASEIEDFSNFLKETSQLDHFVKSADPVDEYDEDELVSDHAWEESGKFEGDLILNDRQRRLIVANVAEGLARNGLTDTTKRWPNNEVVYFIQKEHFSSDQVQAIQSGIDDLAQASCVKFTPYKKGDRDAVVIQGSRRGCFSQVGYQGGYQVLNLSGRHPVGRGCFRHGTVVHELLHTLGFYHMQSSPDRDDYINVAWDNIIKPARHNFRKYNSFSVSDFGVGYDYDSVLHYSRKAFSANGQDTLVPKQSGADIGQRIGLSDKDTQKLNKMYCDADSDLAQDNDDSDKKQISKKKAKNKPFEGHGIGYEKGKTVVIKLPTAKVYSLRDLPQMFNYFSSAPETVPAPPIQGLGAIQEIEKSLVPITTLNLQNIQSIPKDFQDQYLDRNLKSKTRYSDVTDEAENMSYRDEDVINEAFHRLSKMIQDDGYPEDQTTKDYSGQSKKHEYNLSPESTPSKNIHHVNSYLNVEKEDQNYKQESIKKTGNEELRSKHFSPASFFMEHEDFIQLPHSDPYITRSVAQNPNHNYNLNIQNLQQDRNAYYKLYDHSKKHHNVPIRNEQVYTLFPDSTYVIKSTESEEDYR